MKIHGHEAVIKKFDCPGSECHGLWYIVRQNAEGFYRDMFYVRKDGKWHNGTGSKEDGYWPSREAAQAAIDQHADKPTASAEPPADAGKMVAVGEGRELTSTQLLADLRWLESQAVKVAATTGADPAPELGQKMDTKFDAIRRICKGQTVGISLRYIRAIIAALEGPTTTAETERLRGELNATVEHHSRWTDALVKALPEYARFSGDLMHNVLCALTALREQLAAAERERDAAEAKSQPRYYVMDSLGRHWLVRDVPSLERSVLHEDGEWRYVSATRALKYFASKEAAEAEIARIQAEAASAKGGA